MPEQDPTNRELSEAYFINKQIKDGKISAHKASTMDIGKFISDYLKEHEQKEQPLTITSREFISQERDGYLPDEAAIHLTDKNSVTQARLKMSSQPLALETGDPHVQASYKGGIWFETPKTLEQLKADCAIELKTLMAISVAEELTEEHKQQLVVQLAHGYKEGYEAYFRELREAVAPIQQMFLDILKNIPSDDPERYIQNQAGRAFRNLGEAGVFAINFLLKAYHGKFLLRYLSMEDPAVRYAPFYGLISVLGTKDINKLKGIYFNTLADEGFITPGEAQKRNPVPTNKLLEGISIAEVGGSFPRYFEDFGATCFYNREKSFYAEQVSMREEEQITLRNYKFHFPQVCDFTFSREVLDMGSGIQTGFGSMDEASTDLLAAFANMTKKGGYTIHEGNHVPRDPKLLEKLGLKLIGILPTQQGTAHNNEPVYVFEKISDKEIKPEDLH